MQLQSPFQAISPSLDGDVLMALASTRDEFTVTRLRVVLPERSIAGIRLVADRLADQGIVLRRITGRTRSYRLNDAHLLAEAVRTIATAKATLIRQLSERVSTLPVTFAALFGSAATGGMRVDSDIDVLLVTHEAEADLDEAISNIATWLTAYTGNDAHFIQIDETDLADPRHSALLDDIRETGITLAGDPSALSAARRRTRASR